MEFFVLGRKNPNLRSRDCCARPWLLNRGHGRGIRFDADGQSGQFSVMQTKPLTLVVVLVIIAPWILSAGVLDDLSAADKARVEAGEQVLISTPVPGYPWPRAEIFQRTRLPASAIMAVFFDYNQALNYVPNCKVSKISKQITPVLAEVDYQVDVPVLPDEAYTAENALKRVPGGGYAVYWRVLRATSIESSAGSLYVEPMGDGSVLRYTNLVKPASKAAFLLRSVAISQMKDTVSAIVTEAESMESKSPIVVKGKIQAMETALNAPN